ncbi:hypothetical protein [Actinoplanes couchii]|uniref:Transmembrane protein n=1 Tax=Actinoplanes couchii TaxID=403638 RepID=A0ABQ3XDV6_9ACTN|nr:hypothetical protein [Actinoplanes couchii]MDR6317203.1 hypothetical protein [Actinoplanes couchii]GID56695.1 hypothetical protein Aco03nite_050990 [Actinoplanes couchii]
MINLVMLLSWVLAWMFFAPILFHQANRYMLPVLIPPGTMKIVAVGVIVGLPSVLIYLLRRRFVAVLLWNQINPRHLGISGVVVLVVALLLAQLARFVDPATVGAGFFLILLFFYAWVLRRLHGRFPPPEDWNPMA